MPPEREQPAQGHNDNTETRTAPRDISPAPAGGSCVLLVDDQPGIRRIARRMLESAGYRVIEAADGEEAEQVFEQNAGSIRLVVTDVIMPGGGGPDLIRRLRLRTQDLKVLFMSGYMTPADVAHSGVNHGTPFLHKPFTSAQFLAHVRAVLDQ